MDTRAIHHVLSHSENYYKPDPTRLELGSVLGHGLIVVEGDTLGCFARGRTAEISLRREA